MYKLLFLVIFVVGTFSGYSQTELETRVSLDEQMESSLQPRLRQALQQSGIVIDTLSTIVLSAEMTLGKEGRIEGNVTRHIATYDLLWEARLSGSGELFHTALIELTGSAANPTKARLAAMRQLQSGNRNLRQATEQLQADYQRVMNDNCSKLLLQANQLKERQQLLAALALADGIPLGSPCYEQARNQRLNYYQAYQQQYCQQHLEQARRQLALELPKAALEEISRIDPSSPCAEEARQVLEEAATKLKDQQAAKAQFLRQVYQNQVEVETARTKVISELIEGQ